jgi:hypothetical protein
LPTHRVWAMRFPYTAYEVESTPAQPHISVVYRPVIPFRVVGTGGAAVFYGLLDSGADETILPRAMAEFVGAVINPSQTALATSASGEMTVAYGKVTLEVGKGRGRYRWRAIVGVVDQPWEAAILGPAGFLHYFNAAFSWQKREVRLMRNTVALPATSD